MTIIENDCSFFSTCYAFTINGRGKYSIFHCVCVHKVDQIFRLCLGDSEVSSLWEKVVKKQAYLVIICTLKDTETESKEKILTESKKVTSGKGYKAESQEKLTRESHEVIREEFLDHGDCANTRSCVCWVNWAHFVAMNTEGGH